MRQVYKQIDSEIKSGLGIKEAFQEDASNADTITSIVSNAIFKIIAGKSDHAAIKAAMATKGDFTKMTGYKETLEAMQFIITASASTSYAGKQAVKVRQLATLIKNVAGVLTAHKADFMNAFKKGKQESKSIQYVFAGVAAATIYSASILISNCVDLQSMPDGTVKPIINEDKADLVAGSLPITRLQRFYDTTQGRGFNQVFKESVEFDAECLSESVGFIGAIAASVTVALALLFIARDLISWIFQLRQKAAGWLEVQGTLLRLNAARLTPGGVRRAQEGYADKFFSLASSIKVTALAAERTAQGETETENREVEAEVTRANTLASITSGGNLL